MKFTSQVSGHCIVILQDVPEKNPFDVVVIASQLVFCGHLCLTEGPGVLSFSKDSS